MVYLDTYKREFRQQATDLGYSESNIVKCLNYAEILYQKNLPIIYNLTHLSKLVGFKRSYIAQAAVVSKHSNAYYRYYKIPKKNQGKRIIQEPLPNLKDIQHWILNNLLYQIPCSQYSKAYLLKKGLKENLKFHRNQEKVVSLDVKDFFPSIKYNSVNEIFIELGYSKTVSNYLAKLCCLRDSLPQGAPTSPYISNLVMKEVDEKIGEFCINKNIRFTRYADDLTFSGDFDEDELIVFVEDSIEPLGMILNKKKTRVMLKSQRQIVTGVLVNEKMQLPKDQRKNLRLTMYYIKKYGLDEHVKRINLEKQNYLNHLIGKIGFGLYLNPKDKELREYKFMLMKLLKEE